MLVRSSPQHSLSNPLVSTSIHLPSLPPLWLSSVSLPAGKTLASIKLICRWVSLYLLVIGILLIGDACLATCHTKVWSIQLASGLSPFSQCKWHTLIGLEVVKHIHFTEIYSISLTLTEIEINQNMEWVVCVCVLLFPDVTGQPCVHYESLTPALSNDYGLLLMILWINLIKNLFTFHFHSPMLR